MFFAFKKKSFFKLLTNGKKENYMHYFFKPHKKNHLGILPLTIWIISTNFIQEKDAHERKGNHRVNLREKRLGLTRVGNNDICIVVFFIFSSHLYKLFYYKFH